MAQINQLRVPKIKLVPATLAIVIQVAALIFVFLSVLMVSYVSTVRFSLLSLVLLQSLFATVLCQLVGMPTWWRWIQAIFPLAIWGMSMWTVPNEVYLIGFLISLSMFWTTFRSQVPFFPSRPIVWQKVNELIPRNRSLRMIDIGSGLGDLSMHIAKAKSKSQIEGIEIAPLPWLISSVRARLRRSTATFRLGSYHDLDFADYDLVFAYLSPAAMPALWQKAQQDMQAGSLLVSYEFDIPGVPPTYTIESGLQSPTIFVWEMQA